MPWSGGVFNRLNGATGWVDDANAFIGIEATRHDTQDNDFRDGINACLNKDGSNAVTGNLNIANYRLTAVGAATARTDAPQVAQVQDGDFIWLGTVGGTATALTANAAPAITAYKAGQKFKMITASGSTGSTATAHTLAINGLASPKNIVNNEDSTNPTLGTWVSGALIELIYDGTNFRITNDSGGWLTYTPTIATTSGGSISSVVATRAKYRKRGKSIELSLYITFNTTGVGATITCTIPVNSNFGGANYSINPYRSVLAATNGIGLALNEASNTIYTLLVNAAVGAWGTSANAVNINFSYESV